MENIFKRVSEIVVIIMKSLTAVGASSYLVLIRESYPFDEAAPMRYVIRRRRGLSARCELSN